MKYRLPQSTQNWLSLAGATIAAISFFMIVFLFTISLLFLTKGNYIGLVIYIILPMFMVVGLVLIPIGMYGKRKQLKKKKITEPGWPKIDLNDKRYRNAFFIFIIGSAILLFVSAIGSYEAFHFTESVEFCGEVCHTVMEPEFTAYQNSSHARVACVACHVGSGVDWYAKSKLSGLRQVIAVIFDTYETPIPTPIQNLRPARETCEECHWPQKFYANSLHLERHYLTDEENTEWDIHLQMKTSAGISARGLNEGIHWHINSDVQIDYFPGDDENETIPWVKYINKKTGEEHIYTAGDEPDVLDNKMIRTMDCMDCHNRPSHSYNPPSNFVDDGISAGDIPRDLPEIKSLSMEIFEAKYETSVSAHQSIRTAVLEFYKENYEEIFKNDMEIIEMAISGLIKRYSENIFPGMQVSWQVYPNNIGHQTFNGCFRCHNNEMESESGRMISNDCNLCHTILAQGTPGDMETAPYGEALEFKHPDGDEDWKDTLCVDCHEGLSP